MSFNSVYWRGAALNPALARAAEQLDDGSITYAERVVAFMSLLTANDTVARCVALDYLSLCFARQRHGPDDDSFIEAVSSDAHACALRELAELPYDRAEPEASIRHGANHASAFYVMWHLVTPSDAPALARALATNQDPAVLEAGLGAASALAYDAVEIDLELAGVLLAMIGDAALPSDVRASAVSAIGVTAGETYTPVLERMLESPDITVASASALLLLQRDPSRFRARVARIASQWPMEGHLPAHLHEARHILDSESS